MDLGLPILLIGFWELDCSIIREYHYVNLSLTWNDAQAYCRSTYSDLASVHSHEDLKLLYRAAGTPVRKGWIGLHHVKYNWSWTITDSYRQSNGDGAFLKWTNATAGQRWQCAFFQGGRWKNIFCSRERNFVCQNAEFKYFLIERMMDWTRALEYCRSNYTDLANIRSDADKTALTSLSGDQAVWIGLHNRWRWTDGNLFTLHSHKDKWIAARTDSDSCVFLNESLETLVQDSCSNSKPFYCHRDVRRQFAKSQTVRITINSPYNIDEDPTRRQVILQQIHNELSKHNPGQNFTVTWKQQNGQVFQGDGRGSGTDEHED